MEVSYQEEKDREFPSQEQCSKMPRLLFLMKPLHILIRKMRWLLKKLCQNIVENKTVIVIAHRLSTITDSQADFFNRKRRADFIRQSSRDAERLQTISKKCGKLILE